MQWVVGTGRCGIHNYTALMGGFVQSKQDWKITALEKYHGENYDKHMVKTVLTRRKNLRVPCVADCAQFMFIDEIKSLDPNAEFIWLIRNKQKCVDSFMKKAGEEYRIHPKGWEFREATKRQLLEWYYDEVNKIISDGLVGTKFTVIDMETMPKAKEEDIDALRIYA